MPVPDVKVQPFTVRMRCDDGHNHMRHHITNKLTAQLHDFLAKLPGATGEFVFQLHGTSESNNLQQGREIMVNNAEISARSALLHLTPVSTPIYGRLVVPKVMGDFVTVYERLRLLSDQTGPKYPRLVSSTDTPQPLNTMTVEERVQHLREKFPDLPLRLTLHYLAWVESTTSPSPDRSLILVEPFRGTEVLVAHISELFLQSLATDLGHTWAFMAKVWKHLTQGGQPIRILGATYYPINLRQWQATFDPDLEIREVCTGVRIRPAHDTSPILPGDIVVSPRAAVQSLMVGLSLAYDFVLKRLDTRFRDLQGLLDSEVEALAMLDAKRKQSKEVIDRIQENLNAIAQDRRDIVSRQAEEQAAGESWQQLILGPQSA